MIYGTCALVDNPDKHQRSAVPFPDRWSLSLMKKSFLPTKFNHMSTKPTPSPTHTFCTCVLIVILLQCLCSWPLPPITSNIPDNTIYPIRAFLSVLTDLLHLPTMADLPAFSVLFISTCTRTAPPVLELMKSPTYDFIYVPNDWILHEYPGFPYLPLCH